MTSVLSGNALMKRYLVYPLDFNTRNNAVDGGSNFPLLNR